MALLACQGAARAIDFKDLSRTASIAAPVQFSVLSLARLQVCDAELVDRSRSCVPRIGRLV
jgi:hypothetical protein